MDKIIDRLKACGMDEQRAKVVTNYYGTEGKWEDLEKYVEALEILTKESMNDGL